MENPIKRALRVLIPTSIHRNKDLYIIPEWILWEWFVMLVIYSNFIILSVDVLTYMNSWIVEISFYMSLCILCYYIAHIRHMEYIYKVNLKIQKKTK